MKILFFAFLFLINPLFLFSQTSSKIEYYKSRFFLYPSIGTDSAIIYVDKVFISKKPIDLAFAYVAKRHLLTITNENFNDEEYISKLHSLLANIYDDKNNYLDLSNIYNIAGNSYLFKQNNKEALNYFLPALKYAEKTDNIAQIIKVRNNIISVKGNIDLYNEALEEIGNNIALLEKNKNSLQAEYYHSQQVTNYVNSGIFNTEMYIKDKKNNTKYAELSFQNYQKALEISGKIKDFKKSNILYKIGILFNEKGKYDEARKYLMKSIILAKKTKNINDLLLSYFHSGVNFFETQQYNLSKKNFLKVDSIYKKDSLIREAYLDAAYYLAKIYNKQRNSDSASLYSDIYLKYKKEEFEKSKKEFISITDSLKLNEIQKINEEKDKLGAGLKIVIVVCLLLLIFGIFYFVKYKKNKKTSEKRLNELLVKLQNNQPLKPIIETQLISNEQEEKILNSIKKLEDSLYFLKPELSQHTMAKKIGTNTTYLSKIINTHKKMSFNEYINDIRINYIITKLYEDKSFRKYTVQAIAETAGYKNSNSFHKIFKEKTGATPMQFIEKITNQD
ncbi:hypothetical protein DRF60_13000 [Chryseobacterium elymi]|uniref:HTH araC/xylS-type domain-containing protein n=1 Tax=Chryseobacterium elymi TaxID=395936 RepID=A0A3D9DFL8_9FLAO|nr:helix-turn-helix domain-containing protein [Chryseobacterium elymi]REC76804.1 hypothetical protein DRF60_13000 [Chryseobacterium elymi]